MQPYIFSEVILETLHAKPCNVPEVGNTPSRVSCVSNELVHWVYIWAIYPSGLLYYVFVRLGVENKMESYKRIE